MRWEAQVQEEEEEGGGEKRVNVRGSETGRERGGRGGGGAAEETHTEACIWHGLLPRLGSQPICSSPSLQCLLHSPQPTVQTPLGREGGRAKTQGAGGGGLPSRSSMVFSNLATDLSANSARVSA